MPHQCIGCEKTYEDGSESVLSGCVDCSGTTFQYVPSSKHEGAGTPDTSSASTDDSSASTDAHLGGGFISVGDDDRDDSGVEDASQHSARTDVVDMDALPDHPTPEAGDTVPHQGSDDSHAEYDVDLDAIRQELNRQFEGIHIRSPGHYELNLMELYRREECIITLHEDGRYAIGVPGDDDFSLDETEG